MSSQSSLSILRALNTKPINLGLSPSLFRFYCGPVSPTRLSGVCRKKNQEDIVPLVKEFEGK
jgi:hypothetical protein